MPACANASTWALDCGDNADPAEAAAWTVPMVALWTVQATLVVVGWGIWVRRYLRGGTHRRPRPPVLESLFAVALLNTSALLVMGSLRENQVAGQGTLFCVGFTLFIMTCGAAFALELFVRLSFKVTRAGRLLKALKGKAKPRAALHINEDLVIAAICRLLELLSPIVLVLTLVATVQDDSSWLVTLTSLSLGSFVLTVGAGMYQIERVIRCLYLFAGNRTTNVAPGGSRNRSEGADRSGPSKESEYNSNVPSNVSSPVSSPVPTHRRFVLAVSSSRPQSRSTQPPERANASSGAGRQAPDVRTYDAKMLVQVRELRQNQIIILLIIVPLVVFLATSAAQVIPLNLFFVLGLVAFETITLILGLAMFNPRLCKKRKRQADNPGGDLVNGSVAGGGGIGFLSGAQHSLFSTGVLVQREGQTGFAPVTLHELEKELKNGFVLADDGEAVSVVVEKSVLVVESEVLLFKLLPESWVTKISGLVASVTGGNSSGESEELVRLTRSTFFIWLLLGVGEISLIGSVLCNVGPWFLSVLPPIIAIAELFFASACLSREILQRLSKTSFLVWRVISTIFSIGSIIVALLDARVLVVTLIGSCNVLVFLSDAYTLPLKPLRMFICLRMLCISMMIPILILMDAVPSINIIVPASSTFDYSILQLVRDTQGAQIVILLFEVLAVARGAHKRRFLHLGQKVSFSILTFDEMRMANRQSRAYKVLGRKGKFDARASKLEVHSDFFVKQQSMRTSRLPNSLTADAFPSVNDETREQASPVRVFVNQVELKQHDALAVAWLGEDRARSIFDFFAPSSVRKILMDVTSYGIAWFILLSFPFLGTSLPSWIPLFALVPLIVQLTKRVLTTSSTVAKLLVSRRAFQTTLFFTIVWLIMVSVQFRDEKIAWALFMAEYIIAEELVDAQLVVSRKAGRFFRVWEKIQLGLMLVVFTAFMIAGNVLNRKVYVPFRPDLVVNSTINSDFPSVVDEFQSAVDLSLSMALERLIIVSQLLRKNRPNYFQLVKAPIVPKYVKTAAQENNRGPAF